MKYNPFKMWGSYAGFVLGFLIIWQSYFGNSSFWFFLSFSFFGFLIGWGIHSAFREIKPKNKGKKK